MGDNWLISSFEVGDAHASTTSAACCLFRRNVSAGSTRKSVNGYMSEALQDPVNYTRTRISKPSETSGWLVGRIQWCHCLPLMSKKLTLALLSVPGCPYPWKQICGGSETPPEHQHRLLTQ